MHERSSLATALALPLAFALATAAPAAPQVGGPPIPPPTAGAVLSDIHFVAETATAFRLLTGEVGGTPGNRMVVYDIDGAGNVQLDDVFGSTDSSPFAFSSDRILTTVGSTVTQVRVFERGASGWGVSGLITGSNLGPVRYGDAGHLDGRFAAISSPGTREIELWDLSVNGSALQTGSIALPNARIATRMRLEGSTLVAVVQSTGITLSEVDVLVYEKGALGWTLVQTVAPPPGIAWDTSFVTLDLDGDRLALGLPRGDATDPCGRVYIYERAGSDYLLDAEVRGDGVCQVNDVAGTRFGNEIRVRGDALLVSSEYGGLAERFERTAAGWSQVSRHLNESNPQSRYRLVGPYVSGTSRLGLQLFDAVDSEGDIRVVCPAAAPAALVDGRFTDWILFPGRRSTLDVATVSPEIDVLEPFESPDPMVLVIGTERGGRVLGPNATLCVGGSLRRQLMTSTSIPGVARTSYRATFDAAALGALPGDTLLLQAWRASPTSGTGPATSSAVAVTFRP
ncbi:MAG: hypothetical protein AAGI22_20115 [Planctomycetota bacterium]